MILTEVTGPAQIHAESARSNPARPDPARSEKGAATRSVIADAAQELFLERGYDKTTMRAVAERAGVSLGNAYYYYASKEHLVQAFYDTIQREHAAAADAALGHTAAFADRLRITIECWIDVAAPTREFAGKFFKVAAEPTSPLSPFSEESAPARTSSIDLYRRVVEGSDLKVAPAIRSELPELLWLYQMGIVLFWVYDRSENNIRTRTLVRHSVPLLDKLLRLTRVPGVRRVAEEAMAIIPSLRKL